MPHLFQGAGVRICNLEHSICVLQARPDAAEAVALASAAVAAVPSLQEPVVQALNTHMTEGLTLSHIEHGWQTHTSTQAIILLQFSKLMKAGRARSDSFADESLWNRVSRGAKY